MNLFYIKNEDDKTERKWTVFSFFNMQVIFFSIFSLHWMFTSHKGKKEWDQFHIA